MRSRRRRLGGAALHVCGLVTVVCLLAVTVQAHAEGQERAAFPPPGQLVDIGGSERIHLRTWGERETGKPALILDVSAGMPSSGWAWIGRVLGARHFVVAYDRPGMAWSDGPKRPRDAMSAARALALALDVAGIGPPYVVVAHSYGGFSARAFTAMQRDDVIALMLLDTTHPDGGGGPGFALSYRARAWQAHAALFRVFPPANGLASLPSDEQAAAHAVSHWTSHLDTTAEELEAWDVSAAQIRDVRLDDLPLLVVSGRGSDEHLRLQRDLLSLSTASRFRQLDADHMEMLLEHGHAQATAAEIERFISSR